MHQLSNDQIQAVIQLIRTCGGAVPQLAQQTFEVYEKGRQDYVTDIDRMLDRQLTEGFTCLFPTDRIITEENASSWEAFTATADRLWLIDPLDGTEDFIQGSAHYALMAGLLIQHQPALGWIYAPTLDRLYYGGRSTGIFLQTADDKTLQTLQPVEPAPPSHDFCPILVGYKDQKRFGAAIQQQIPAAQFDCVGSFGLKVMHVLEGQAGLYLYLNGRVKLWDTTGPLAIAQAAGLICCDLEGQPLRFTPDAINPQSLAHDQPILVGWPSYVEALLPKLQQAVLSQTAI